jgi:hypothetical protein
MERALGALRSLPIFPAVTYNGSRRKARMSQRPIDTLEVHVSFEGNRFASIYLIDAYELLLPTVAERKPVGVAKSILSPSLEREKQAAERKTL